MSTLSVSAPVTLRIRWDRLQARLNRLNQIGALEGGGVCRLALTPQDKAARDLLVSWMLDLGLEVKIDPIGNIFGIRAGRSEQPGVMTGSHIDTVRTGGYYDGTYGVLAGLEVVEMLNEAGIQTERPLIVAAFTNEEGARFTPDMMGSMVYNGDLDLQEALATVGSDGSTVGENLTQIGYAGSMPFGSIPLHGFIELHIEQGPVLEQQGITIGAVTSVQGMSWREYTVQGVSNHAGTTPLALRHDAGYVAASITTYARQLALEMGGNQIATVGSIQFKPNLINVIPYQAIFTVDLRNTDESLLQLAEQRLEAKINELAHAEGVTVTSRSLVRLQPALMDPSLIKLVEETAKNLGFSVRQMPSGAGHDAGMFAPHYPTGMIFVPSVEGLSHNVKEYTDPQDLTAGANILLQALLTLLSVTT